MIPGLRRPTVFVVRVDGVAAVFLDELEARIIRPDLEELVQAGEVQVEEVLACSPPTDAGRWTGTALDQVARNTRNDTGNLGGTP